MLQSDVDEMANRKDPGEFDPDWSKIRRGWFWGSDEFGRTLLDKLDGIRSKTKPDSLGGQAIRFHNEHQAEQLKAQGLAVLDLDESDLASMTKGSAEKRVLVWFIKSHTTVSNTWLSDHLYCGHPSNVAKYVQSIRKSKDRKIAKQCKRLLKTLGRS
jgi:hypothetical protein